MSLEEYSSVEETVLSILRSFVGTRVAIDRQKLIGRELGISGGDSVELLDELEEKFGVDLNPLVEKATLHLEPSWFDRIRGREQGPAVADVTVGDLVQFIEAATRG